MSIWIITARSGRVLGGCHPGGAKNGVNLEVELPEVEIESGHEQGDPYSWLGCHNNDRGWPEGSS